MRRPWDRTRRTWLLFVLFALLTCASLALAWMLLVAEFASDAVQTLTGIVSMFTGVWALGASVHQLLPPPAPPPGAEDAADQLAGTVREEWTEEATARQLRDPRVIPLSWAATELPVAAPTENILGVPGVPGGRVLRLSLDGRLEGDFNRAAAQLAAGYRQVPAGRLVVLGEPGSGKTVLALMLTLGLLADRTPRAPVPVLLSVSTWDPVIQSLDDWITDSLAGAYYSGRTDVPRMLLNQRLLLPVLDGLDEMPEQARRSAVRALNEACGDGRGVVLTCRSAEYEDVIEGGSPVLRTAPVVEVAPVSVSDAVDYLEEVNWPQGVDWEPVFTHLRRHPDSPVATALSTPLSLTLARTIYRHCDRDPAELVAFDSRHEVEDHLVDHIIPAAYAPPPGHLPEHATREWQHAAQRAERWLTFLATYLHRHRERDLVWWHMSGRLLPRWTGLLIGIAVFLSITLPRLVTGHIREDAVALADYLADTSAGWIVGGLVTLTWYVAPERPPGRMSFALRGSLHRLRTGFRTGFTLASVVAVPLLGYYAVTEYDDGSVHNYWSNFATLGGSGVGATIVIGAAFAVRGWLDARPEHSSRATPTGLLHQDRTSSLAGAGISGVFLAVVTIPVLLVASALGYMVFLALTQRTGLPGFADVLAMGADEVLFFFPFAAAVGAVFAVLILVLRAWPRFVLLRLFLAARGKLPWRFVGFLTDARDRQLLRRSAGTYQFRHIRLQERLTSRSLARDRTSVTRTGILRRRIPLVVAGLVLATGGLLGHQLEPEVSPRVTLATGYVDRMVLGPPGTHVLATFHWPVALDSPSVVRLWDTRTGQREAEVELTLKGDLRSWDVAAREDGVVVVNPRHSAEAWRIPWDGLPEPLIRADFPVPSTYPEKAGHWKVSPGGRYLTAEAGQHLRMWDTDTGEEVEPPRHYRKGHVMAISDSGTFMVQRSLGSRETKLASDRRRCSIPTDPERAKMNARGTRIVGADGSTAHIWDVRCRKTVSIFTQEVITEQALNTYGTELAVYAGGWTRVYELPRPGR